MELLELCNRCREKRAEVAILPPGTYHLDYPQIARVDFWWRKVALCPECGIAYLSKKEYLKPPPWLVPFVVGAMVYNQSGIHFNREHIEQVFFANNKENESELLQLG